MEFTLHWRNHGLVWKSLCHGFILRALALNMICHNSLFQERHATVDKPLWRLWVSTLTMHSDRRRRWR